MDNFTQELNKDIKKLVGTLKDEEQLAEVLKRKLTKKEFKYFKLKISNTDEATIQKELQCDAERFEAIKKQTIVKLNQEKIKKELIL
ncbi:hypothetical protein OAR97_04155 [Arcobacteraceae bacterium]|nr:hypothetical protein [Arcobacteraceae bacterium]